MREVPPHLGSAQTVNPRETDALELDHVVHLEGGNEGLGQAPGHRPIGHHEMGLHPVRDPLDLRDFFVLHRDEFRTSIQYDVAEVLEPNFFSAELLEVLAGHLDLRPRCDLPVAATREVRMERRLHALDRRQAGDLDRDRVGYEEVPVRVFVDHLAGFRVQRLRRNPWLRPRRASPTAQKNPTLGHTGYRVPTRGCSRSAIRNRTRSRNAGFGSAMSVFRRTTASPSPYSPASIAFHIAIVSSTSCTRCTHARIASRFFRNVSASHSHTYASPVARSRSAHS